MPMTAAIIGSVAAPVIGGVIGADQASKDRDAAQAARNQALQQFAGISTPDIQSQLLQLQQYQNAGQLNPALTGLVQQGDSALNGVSTDPRLRADQMGALAQMSNLATGNLKPSDTAGYELARQNAAGEMQAKNNQVLQQMQQRGQAGSGAELLSQLKNNQSGAEMLQTAQLQQAQAMQQARLQALSQQASMAGNIRTQDYGEQSALAKAQDAIAQFNAQNSQSVNNANTNTKNSAQQFNLTNAQNIANTNTTTANQQQISNKALQQQQFNNQMQLAGAKAGQYTNQAGADDTHAGQTAGMWAGIGQGAGTGLAGLGNLFGKKQAATATPGTPAAGTSAGDSTFDPSSFA